MNRIEILNSLILKNNYKSFSEIGVQAGHCFNAINCGYKVGVDPDPTSAATLHIPSDEFFDTCKKAGDTFDIYWIDGLHHADQVERDILNALDCLNEGGMVCCHDMLPRHEFGTQIPLRADHDEWWGNVYLTWIKLRQTRPDLEMTVVDCDHGCGIIRKGSQQVLQLASTQPGVQITFQDFERNKQEWMNVISPTQFKGRYL